MTRLLDPKITWTEKTLIFVSEINTSQSEILDENKKEKMKMEKKKKKKMKKKDKKTKINKENEEIYTEEGIQLLINIQCKYYKNPLYDCTLKY